VSRIGRSRWQRPGAAAPMKLLLAAILLAALMASGSSSSSLCALGDCASDCPMHRADADAAPCGTQSCPVSPLEPEQTQNACVCGTQDTNPSEVTLLPENRRATESVSHFLALLPAPVPDATACTGLALGDSFECPPLMFVPAAPGRRAPPTA
jgi:hypothetical protein